MFYMYLGFLMGLCVVGKIQNNFYIGFGRFLLFELCIIKGDIDYETGLTNVYTYTYLNSSACKQKPVVIAKVSQCLQCIDA